VVGGVIGWAAGLMMAHGDRVLILENVAVGVFGAFIGGDFVAAMLSTGIVNDKVFSVRSLGLAIAGAVTLLLILKAMRKAVGPLRHGKSPSRRRE
jgi:uncharacterized membrane protein YeaQ/YmgE (transglycosylase-associated protein family)